MMHAVFNEATTIINPSLLEQQKVQRSVKDAMGTGPGWKGLYEGACARPRVACARPRVIWESR